ncbi:MAG: hypothetical protein AAGL98_03885, partial [Planctomycetota bacterium]
MNDSHTTEIPANGQPQTIAAAFDGEHDATLTISKTRDRRIDLMHGWADHGVWSSFQGQVKKGRNKASAGGLRPAHAIVPLLLRT